MLPAALAAGPTGAPDNSKCWHCHTNTNGVVTAYRNGQYHSALGSFRATPAGAVTPLPQPTAQCGDCHSAMVPDGIVEKDGSSLWPMDHTAVFATPVVVAGRTVPGVAQIDCSVCHTSPGQSWSGAAFHPNVGAAVVPDCAGCHYQLIADTAVADTQSGTAYAMRHASNQLAFQTCQTCHPSAIPVRATLPATADLWKTGTFHATVTSQPTACLDCHMVSRPAANVPTQSSWSYALAAGGTASNGGQWMSHGSPVVAGKECAACHAADAQKTVGPWSKSISLHAAASGARSCQECHGASNGGGGVTGTRNNLPVGLTPSTTATSASAATGIAAAALAQISHDDVNVTSHDCNFCHTQAGVSTAPGVAGKEWAQARFHASFPTAASLITNRTTGRCSSCHQGENPLPSYSAFGHATFSNAAGSVDCSGCHRFPGTGTASSPNWLGASTAPVR
jgi:cytochrome c551/c552